MPVAEILDRRFGCAADVRRRSQQPPAVAASGCELGIEQLVYLIFDGVLDTGMDQYRVSGDELREVGARSDNACGSGGRSGRFLSLLPGIAQAGGQAVLIRHVVSALGIDRLIGIFHTTCQVQN